MKKTVSVLGCILFALVDFPLFGALLFSCLGYTFKLASVTVYVIVTASLSVCLAVMSVKANESAQSGIVGAMFALLTPLSLINAVSCIRKSADIWAVAAVFICIGCCLFLTVKHGKPSVLKLTSLALSAIAVLPIAFIVFITSIFGNMSQNTVVNTVKSPNGAYCAEVIDSDQGALGGNTAVDVYENKSINAVIFTLSKKPKRVYLGEWGELEHMKIYWKNDNRLVINSVEYEIG